jgi:myo-inositol-1(or 4)-monophosphatase
VTALSPAASDVVRRARDVVTAALDELAPRLLATSGEVAVEAKGDGTPVTDVDREADDHLTSAIVDAFPDHGVLSEERATRSPDTDWTWVLDPIDGTSNFVCGLPYWCVSAALTLEGHAVLGVIDAPVLARRYLGVRGEGGVREDRSSSADGRSRVVGRQPLGVRRPIDWRDRRYRHVPVMLTTGTARRAKAAGLALNPRVMGSTALDLAVVADGAAAASIARVPKAWDVAAGWLLVEEAGGSVVTLEGTPLLPLHRDVEHAQRSAATAAAPDETMARGIAEALLSPG